LEQAISPDLNTSRQALVISEPQFRWDTSQDAAAHHLFADGIRNFAQDHSKMLDLINAPNER
jgi:transaldolase